MTDSVEFRDGVFVATGPTEVEGLDRSAGTMTGTALMVRPDDHLAAVDAPGALVGAEAPPMGPIDSATSPAPAAGGARRAAVATIIASLIAAMAFGAAAFGGAFGGGSTPSPGSAGGALGIAAAASTSATSVAFTVSATRTTPSNTTTLVTGAGAVELKTDTAKLTATVPSLSSLVGSGNDTVNVVADGSTIYLGSPALSSITGGNTWLKASLPGGSTPNADSQTLAVLANPSQLLGLLSSLGGQVTKVGNVNLQGTPTTEYSTSVTLSELTARAGLTTGSKVGAKVAQVLQQLGNTTVPLKVWVGNDGYVRQISASIDLSRSTLGGIAADVIGGVVNGTVPTGTGGQSTTATTVTVGFSNYNDPVAISVPPASDTTDANSILHSLRGDLASFGHTLSNLAARF